MRGSLQAHNELMSGSLQDHNALSLGSFYAHEVWHGSLQSRNEFSRCYLKAQDKQPGLIKGSYCAVCNRGSL